MKNSDYLKRNFNQFLNGIAEDFNISLNSSDIPDKFAELIKKTSKRM